MPANRPDSLLAGDLRIHPRRMSMQPLEARLPSPEEETALASVPKVDGRPISAHLALDEPGATQFETTECPVFWRFARTKLGEYGSDTRVQLDPCGPEFTRIPDPGTQMFTDDSHFESVFDAAFRHYQATVLPRAEHALELYRSGARLSPEDQIYVGEQEDWKKLTLQRGVYPARMLVTLAPPAIDPPPAWHDTLDYIVRLFADQRPVSDPAPPPLDTNAGWPCCTSGFAAKLCGYSLGLEPTVEAIDALSHDFCDMAGVPHVTAQSYVLGFRKGPLYKEQPYLYHSGAGVWSVLAMAKGAWARERQVFMAPSANIVCLEALWAWLQGARRAIPGLWRTRSDYDAVTRVDASGGTILESDISGYDQSVSPLLQEAVAGAIAKHMPHLAAQARMWLYYERRAVMTPSRMLTSGITVYTTRGGTHSGQRLTAEMGTLICLTTCLYVLSVMIPNARRLWAEGDLMLLVQGDDVLLGLPAGVHLDAARWEELWATAGLKCSLLPGRRFLAKHRVAGRAYPVGGRILQQTLSNEHEPRYDATPRYQPLLTLGLRARWGDGPYPSLTPMLTDVMRRTRLALEAGVYDGSTASAWLQIPDNAAKLSRLLARLAKDPWIERARRDAPYSESAAELLDALAAAGLPYTDAEMQSKTLILFNRVARARRATTQSRLDLAVRMFQLVAEGADDSRAILEASK